MNESVTDRAELIELAQKTLELLHKEIVTTIVTESALEEDKEDARVSRDAIVNALNGALDWARAEEQAARSDSLSESAESADNGMPYIPSNQVLSLLQSAYEEFLEENKTLTEAAFDTSDPGWAKIAFEKLKALMRGKHPFTRHSDLTSFRITIPDNTVVAIFGDWGTGEQTAIRVMQQIRAANPSYAIHLGDVYYSGTPKEAQERFIGIIEKHGPSILDPLDPTSKGCRFFSLNGNHDMYSGGYGYFDTILKRIGQPASYFSLSNANWRLVGLDSGYEEFGLQDPQLEWLTAQLQAGGQKNILLSHHQLFSPYEGRAQNRTLLKKTTPLLPKVFAWFWGHEHRCIILKDHLGIKPRCVGHGAIPTPVPFGAPEFPEIAIEKVDERASPEGGEFHGFALLRFSGATVDVRYIDEAGTTFHTETLR